MLTVFRYDASSLRPAVCPPHLHQEADMRLFPPELEIGPEEGFTPEKDIFGRKEFGSQLTRIVGSLEDPTVILLDAPQGTGKTTFVKMWRGELAKASIPTIYFDAFKHDYHEDAFLALAGEIMAKANAAKLRSTKVVESFKKSAITVAKALTRASFHIGVHVGTAGLLSGTGLEKIMEAGKEITKEASKEAADTVDKLLEKRLESHYEDKQAFDVFSDALKALTISLANSAADDASDPPKSNPPLVFIIDELDRCRPSFALELLEKIKHFFSVPGVVFVLVSSLGQLESAVRYAYGEIDARTYLEKFYHLRILFPTGDRQRRDLRAATYLRHVFSTLLHGDDANYVAQVAPIIVEFDRVQSLSLRTLERIATYIYLVIVSTNNNRLRPPPIVVVLCTMKVMAPNLYSAARSDKLAFSDVDSLLKFGNWRDEYNPAEQSRIGKQVERWWRYYLGEAKDQQEIPGSSDALVGYNTDNPRRVITLVCEIIDGFSFPGAS
jgi:hypothetical protein